MLVQLWLERNVFDECVKDCLLDQFLGSVLYDGALLLVFYKNTSYHRSHVAEWLM
jgi:hypothetical protein